MNDLINTIQEIPPAALVPLAAALILGLLLWAAGRRVLRTGFAAIGLLMGFFIGWLLGEAVGINIGLPSWAYGVILGVILAVVAVILYRAAIAGAMAIILAVASPMAVVALHEWQGRPVWVKEAQAEPQPEDPAPYEPEDPVPQESDELDQWLQGKADEYLRDQADERLPAIPEEIKEHLEHIRSFGEQLIASLREAWATTDEAARPSLIGAAISGFLLGIILGGLLPGLSAAVITSFGGSLLWITSLRILVERAGWGDLGFLPATGRGWLIFWLVAALIGFAIQWTIGARKADK